MRSSDGAVALGRSGQARLLSLLALTPGRAVDTDKLIEDLWSDPPESARGILQVNACKLRRVLPPGVSLEGLPGAYVLTGPRPLTDLQAFEDDVAAARARRRVDDRRGAAGMLQRALDRWHARPLIALEDVQGVETHVARLIELRLHAQEEAVELALEMAENEPGIEELRARVEEAPFRETRWGHLMIALYRSGRQAEALAAYREAADRLAAELGVDPGPGLRDVHERILLHDPTLIERGGTAPEVAEPLPPDIPPELGELVGRRDLVEATKGALRTARLVTLVGPGGIGKTRVAQRVAINAIDRYRHGVRWVDVDAAEDDTALLRRVRHLLAGRRTQTMDAPMIPRDRDLLLVLDTCEAQLTAVVTVIEEVMADAPNVCLLATSRTSLTVPGEHVVSVGPLCVREEDGSPGPAVRLLVDRMAEATGVPSAEAGPTLDEELLIDVATRVGGLPLALELAALRVPALSEASLRDGRAQNLLGIRRGGPRRHRSISATIAWTASHLPAAARSIADAVSLLPDGADDGLLSAALDLSNAELDEATAELIRSSVLQRTDGRVRMLDILREHFASRGAADEVRGRLAAALRDAAQTTMAAYSSPTRLDVYTATGKDHRNHLAAITWSLDAGRGDDALMHVMCLSRFWGENGHADIGARTGDAVLQDTPSEPAHLRVPVMLLVSWLHLWRGDSASGQRFADEALEIATEIGDVALQGLSEHARGNLLAFAHGRLAEGLDAFDNAIDLLASVDHPRLAASMVSAAWAYAICGQIQEGEALLAQTRRVHADRMEPVIEVGEALADALLALYSDDLDRAARAARRGLCAIDRMGVLQLRSQLLCVLAWRAIADGDGEAALANVRAALDQAEEAGAIARRTYIFGLGALAAARLGGVDVAESLAARALDSARAESSVESRALAVLARSFVASRRCEPRRAAELLARAEELRLEAGFVWPPPVHRWVQAPDPSGAPATLRRRVN